ncbi:GNAT family N-acetyltransferase [Cecembia lonarensis]|uniref:Acetyltransferase (GNAT) family protein n=1 Tax=Cecembia lonarensis (strain CCUG 58316 / KCTC 22772 / LW9) TaxID=1225176 RepID=K1L469_CECL9|nr:GNAT family N-acetyltransferase [Cecembia lonarensis]EKB49601.1 Acetyltransferase (GNAT) family protein [Cecembia lonarensis LW9]
MVIRKADIERDFDGVWEIFLDVISRGDVFSFLPETPKSDLKKLWFADNMDTFVAVDNSGKIVGSYYVKPNQPGLGSHIANGGYMVHSEEKGKGIGRLLCQHSIDFAREKGYLGMQFNMVISTNASAVKLWKSFGFLIIGTIPQAFRHQKLGLVDAYIMYKSL